MIFYSFKILPLLILIILVTPLFLYSQDVDIVQYLKQIERGRVDEVKSELTDLKIEYPESPSIMFLDGVLTENGQTAVVIYQKIVDAYPNSKYADAALYRIYSYYYALGLYESADKKLIQLINNHPESPYIKVANGIAAQRTEILLININLLILLLCEINESCEEKKLVHHLNNLIASSMSKGIDPRSLQTVTIIIKETM